MRILAIDPGTYQSAWVIFNSGTKEVTAGIEKNPVVLERVRVAEWFGAVPDVTVIEEIKCYGNVMGDELIQTCVWIGRFIEARTVNTEIPPQLIPRKKITTQLCNQPRANDTNVRAALIDLWGGKTLAIGNSKQPGPLHDVKKDMWSALAVAVGWYECEILKRDQLERALQ